MTGCAQNGQESTGHAAADRRHDLGDAAGRRSRRCTATASRPPEMALGLTYLRAIEARRRLPVVLPPVGLDGDRRRCSPASTGICLSGGPDLDPAAYGARAAPRARPDRARARRASSSRVARARRRPRAADPRRSAAARRRSTSPAAARCTSTCRIPTEIATARPSPATAADPIDVARRSRCARSARRLGIGASSRQLLPPPGRRPLGDGLRVVAQAPDGTVEAIEDRAGAFVVGVQWHAEAMVDTRAHLAIFERLVAVRGRRRLVGAPRRGGLASPEPARWPRAPRAPRRRPRPRAWRRCGAPSTWPTRTSSPSAVGIGQLLLERRQRRLGRPRPRAPARCLRAARSSTAPRRAVAFAAGLGGVGRGGLARFGRSPSPLGRARPAAAARAGPRPAPCAPRARARTRPSRRRRSAARRPRPRPCACRRRRAARGRGRPAAARPGTPCSASSSASRLSMSRWLVGSSRISTLAPPCDEDRQRQPLALAAAEAVQRLLGLLAAEQEPAEQRARLARRQARRACRRLEHRARAARPRARSACWER